MKDNWKSFIPTIQDLLKLDSDFSGLNLDIQSQLLDSIGNLDTSAISKMVKDHAGNADEFTAYLERYGVVVKINEVLRKLYEGSIDKNNPIKNPIDYLKKELGDKSIPEENIDNELKSIKEKNKELKKQKEKLEKEYNEKKFKMERKNK